MASASAPIHELGERGLLPPGTTFNDITEAVCRVTEEKAPRGWWMLFLPSVGLLGLMVSCIVYLLSMGIGVW